MDLDFKKKIEERMNELPTQLSAAIRSSGWESIVFDIGRKYSLHVDDIGEIQNELILVLTGITHPDEFRSILISELKIPEDKVDLIIGEINQQINEKIKKALHDDPMFADAEIEEDDSNITSAEKATMQAAGISVGDDALREEVAGSFVPIEGGEVVKAAPNVVTAGAASAAPAPAKPAVAPPAPAPKPAPAAPTAQIFRTKVAEIATADKPNNFFDPYREPIE